jgi:hypothetical protein
MDAASKIIDIEENDPEDCIPLLKSRSVKVKKVGEVC